MTGHVLAIDQGTTSSAPSCSRADCTVAAIAQQEFRSTSRSPGWVEHDPEESVAHRAGDRPRGDRQGRPRRAATSRRSASPTSARPRWCGIAPPASRSTTPSSGRTAAPPRCADALKDAGHETLVVGAHRPAARSLFLRHQDRLAAGPSCRARGRRRSAASSPSAPSIPSCCGASPAAPCTRPTPPTPRAPRSTISTPMPGARELCALFGVPAALLPQVRDCAAEYGTTAAVRRRDPDPRHCRRPAGGADRPGLLRARHDEIDLRHRLLRHAQHRRAAWSPRATGCSPPSRIGSTGETVYGLEGAIFIAGAAVQWLRDGLGIVPSAAADRRHGGSGRSGPGRVLVPAFVGLGAPYWDAEARGALFGLTRATGPNELARAALESVCFQTLDLRRRHAGRLRRCRLRRHRAARRRRHGGVRLDHAAARRHPRRAGRPSRHPGNHRARRRLPGRAAIGPLSGAASFRDALVARPPLHRRDGRRRRARASSPPGRTPSGGH